MLRHHHRTRRRPLAGALLIAALAALCAIAPAARADVAPLGSLSQLPGAAGCFTAVASDGCTTTQFADRAYFLAPSPDGRDLYVAGGFWSTGNLGGLRRGEDGTLTPAGPCYKQLGQTELTCTAIRGLENLIGLVISPDGRHVYVAANGDFSGDDSTITTWQRDAATGALTQVAGADGCVTGAAGLDGCREIASMNEISGLSISPDGRSVFAADAAGSVTILARDAGTGRLSGLAGTAGCVREGAATATCAGGRGLAGVFDVEVSPDGEHAYAAGGGQDGTLAIFDRDAQTGTLTQLSGTAGCITGGAATATCASARGMGGVMFTGDPFALAISPDGTSLYVASADEDTITAFAIDPATGQLTQYEGGAGCYQGGSSPAEGCTAAVALQGTYEIAISPDGQNLYGSSYRGMGNAGGVPAFARGQNGVLTQYAAPFACVTEDDDAACTKARQLWGANDVAVSADGEQVYAAGFDSGSLAVLTRQAPPVCRDATVVVTSGDTVELPVDCREPNREPLSLTVTGAPAHGTLAVDDTTGVVRYTAAAGYAGADSVRVRASDGMRDSAEVTVAITVKARPVAPPPPAPPGGGPAPAPAPAPGPQPVPAPTPARVLAQPVGGTVRVDRRGRLSVRVRCTGTAGATCRGTLTLRSSRPVRLRRGAKARRLALGSARYAIPAGRTASVTVRLGAGARTAVRRLRRVAATAATTPAGGGSSRSARVTVR